MSENLTKEQTAAGAKLLQAEERLALAVANHEEFPRIHRLLQQCNDALGAKIIEDWAVVAKKIEGMREAKK